MSAVPEGTDVSTPVVDVPKPPASKLAKKFKKPTVSSAALAKAAERSALAKEKQTSAAAIKDSAAASQKGKEPMAADKRNGDGGWKGTAAPTVKGAQKDRGVPEAKCPFDFGETDATSSDSSDDALPPPVAKIPLNSSSLKGEDFYRIFKFCIIWV